MNIQKKDFQPSSMRFSRFANSALGSVMILASAASADMVIAENVLPDDGQNFAARIMETSTYAQTFTASAGGTLSTVELPLAAPLSGNRVDPLLIHIWGVDANGEPDMSNVLATRKLYQEDLLTDVYTLDFVSIDFLDANVELTQGEQYSIGASSLTGTAPNWYLWTSRGVFGDDLYSGGQLYFNQGLLGGPWFTNAPDDAQFRVSVVPAPATLALLLGGVSTVCTRRRR